MSGYVYCWTVTNRDGEIILHGNGDPILPTAADGLVVRGRHQTSTDRRYHDWIVYGGGDEDPLQLCQSTRGQFTHIQSHKDAGDNGNRE